MDITELTRALTAPPVTIELDEGQRQIVLLALHKLKLERPGWGPYAIGPIEEKLGGQLDWPDYRLEKQ